jgi:hypothetical protein
MATDSSGNGVKSVGASGKYRTYTRGNTHPDAPKQSSGTIGKKSGSYSSSDGKEVAVKEGPKGDAPIPPQRTTSGEALREVRPGVYATETGKIIETYQNKEDPAVTEFLKKNPPLPAGVYNENLQIYQGKKTQEYKAKDLFQNPRLVEQYQPVTRRPYNKYQQTIDERKEREALKEQQTPHLNNGQPAQQTNNLDPNNPLVLGNNTTLERKPLHSGGSRNVLRRDLDSGVYRMVDLPKEKKLFGDKIIEDAATRQARADEYLRKLFGINNPEPSFSSGLLISTERFGRKATALIPRTSAAVLGGAQTLVGEIIARGENALSLNVQASRARNDLIIEALPKIGIATAKNLAEQATTPGGLGEISAGILAGRIIDTAPRGIPKSLEGSPSSEFSVRAVGKQAYTAVGQEVNPSLAPRVATVTKYTETPQGILQIFGDTRTKIVEYAGSRFVTSDLGGTSDITR